MKKKVLSIVFALILIIISTGSVVFADNISWKFDKGELIISGVGEISDFNSDISRPWDSIKSEIKKIRIEEGITSIGDWSFANLDELSEVTFPKSLIQIGKRAFYGCSALKEIKICDGVTQIGDGAFNSCVSLVRVDLPENLKTIGNSAFMNCPKLTVITIPKNVTDIGKWAFMGCTKLERLYFEGKACQSLGASMLAHIRDNYLVYLSYDNYIEWLDKKYFDEDRIYIYMPELRIPVYINGQEINLDPLPTIYEEKTIIPMRSIFEALGAEVLWEDATKTVTATKGDIEIKLTINDNKMYKNGKVITLEVPAIISGESTMVPLRAVSEALGAEVLWEDGERAVYINF